MNPKTSAKDFFLNLGIFVALYTVVISLVNLLFTVIDTVYPPINSGYYYGNSSTSISWPVSVIIIFFPILVALSWVLEKQFTREPEKKELAVHRWLSYLTLFVSGAILAGDLVAVLYYFIDGQELTSGFLLKVLVVVVATGGVFAYYLSDIRGTLIPSTRKIWRVVSALVILASIVLGFTVIGSPRTQRLLKYDEQKVNDLQGINSQVQNYYEIKKVLPATLAELSATAGYYVVSVDTQTNKPYEYSKTDDKTYKLCAVFNKSADNSPRYDGTARGLSPYNNFYKHSAGYYCFSGMVSSYDAKYPN